MDLSRRQPGPLFIRVTHSPNVVRAGRPLSSALAFLARRIQNDLPHQPDGYDLPLDFYSVIKFCQMNPASWRVPRALVDAAVILAAGLLVYSSDRLNRLSS